MASTWPEVKQALSLLDLLRRRLTFPCRTSFRTITHCIRNTHTHTYYASNYTYPYFAMQTNSAVTLVLSPQGLYYIISLLYYIFLSCILYFVILCLYILYILYFCILYLIFVYLYLCIFITYIFLSCILYLVFCNFVSLYLVYLVFLYLVSYICVFVSVYLYNLYLSI